VRVIIARLHGLARESLHPSRNELSRHGGEILVEAGARVFLSTNRVLAGYDPDCAVPQGGVGVRQRAQVSEPNKSEVVVVMVADPGDLVVELALIEIIRQLLLDRDVCDVEAGMGELLREAALSSVSWLRNCVR